jgi:hypothetical protein
MKFGIAITLILLVVTSAPATAQSQSPAPSLGIPQTLCVRVSLPDVAVPGSLVQGVTIEILDPSECAPQEVPVAADVRLGAYGEYIDHQDATVTRLRDLFEGVFSVYTTDEYAGVRHIRDLLRKERAWLDAHQPNECYRGHWAAYRSSVSKAYQGTRDFYQAIEDLDPAGVRRLRPRMGEGIDLVMEAYGLDHIEGCE